MISKITITGGVYLVVDPAMDRALLLSKLTPALEAGVKAVQLWNNWLPGADKLSCIADVAALCQAKGVPVLIDNDWELLVNSPYLNGVHFDSIPANYKEIQKKIGRHFIAGITCSGNLEVVQWANENNLDYISFCAMFPSSSAGSCDIVMPATVKEAGRLTDLPIFVSGGITPDNIISLQKLTPFDGVAVISGIMSANDPYENVKLYENALSVTKHTS